MPDLLPSMTSEGYTSYALSFRDPGDRPPIRLNWSTRALCILLIGGILALGILPSRVLNTLSTSVAAATGTPVPAAPAVANASH